MRYPFLLIWITSICGRFGLIWLSHGAQCLEDYIPRDHGFQSAKFTRAVVLSPAGQDIV